MFDAVTPKRTIDNHITAKKALLIEGFFYFRNQIIPLHKSVISRA